eukprot:3151864-Karenia_brevis.AAC.1
MTLALEKLFVPPHLPGTPRPTEQGTEAKADSAATAPSMYGPASKAAASATGPYSGPPAQG